MTHSMSVASSSWDKYIEMELKNEQTHWPNGEMNMKNQSENVEKNETAESEAKNSIKYIVESIDRFCVLKFFFVFFAYMISMIVR